MAEKTEKPKTYAEAKKAYDSLAAQCADLVKKLPKIRVEIEARVKKEMGDAQAKLEDLIKQKGDASREMRAAEERERPQREAAERAKAEAAQGDELKAKAEANAARIASEAEQAKHRAASATN